MADTAPIQPVQSTDPVYNVTLQFDPTATLAASASNNTSNIFDLPLATQLATAAQSTQGDNELLQDVLLVLSNPILSLLNEIDPQATYDPVNDNAPEPAGVEETARRIEAFGTLQQDLLQLENAASVQPPTTPLVDNEVAVDLSDTAQRVLEETDDRQPVAEARAAQQSLTNVQIQQLASILAPYVNEPLTAERLEQVQSQLDDVQQGQFLLTPQNLFIVMGYIASMRAAQIRPRQEDNNQLKLEDRFVLKPVSPIDRVGVENSAILS